MPNTAQLLEWDKNHLWHPFTQMRDWLKGDAVIIERGEGVYLIDTDGNRYIDGISSMWTNVHGHAHPALNDAIKKQLDQIAHSTLLGFSNVPAIRLAKKLCELAPKGLNKVFYSDNGSTAVEVALKMAVQYWRNKGKPERNRFVRLSSAYHGDTIGAVSIGGVDVFLRAFSKLLFPTLEVPAPHPYRFPGSNNPDRVKNICLKKMEETLGRHGKEIAAIVMEPLIQGAAGMITHPKGFLQGVEKLARRHGVLLILDEIMTGFGRTGSQWACEKENVRPDILCCAKGLTAGYLPLAATLTTDNIYKAFLGDYAELKTFFHGHTFTGNQLGCAVALAGIEIFEKENLIQNIQPLIRRFHKGLKKFSKLPNVGDIRQCGLAAGIELVRNKNTREEFPFEEKRGIRVCKEALKRGAILRPLVNTIVLMPPLCVSIRELDALLDIVEESIKAHFSGKPSSTLGKKRTETKSLRNKITLNQAKPAKQEKKTNKTK